MSTTNVAIWNAVGTRSGGGVLSADSLCPKRATRLLRPQFTLCTLMTAVAIVAVGSGLLVLLTRLAQITAHAVDGGTRLE